MYYKYLRAFSIVTYGKLNSNCYIFLYNFFGYVHCTNLASKFRILFQIISN